MSKIIELLTADLAKANDNLQNIEFEFGNTKYKFYFKYLTILEHTRINNACMQEVRKTDNNGVVSIDVQKNEEMYPIYLILEKALDEDGKKLFSLTDLKAKQTLLSLPFTVVSYVAANMSYDITGNISKLDDVESE